MIPPVCSSPLPAVAPSLHLPTRVCCQHVREEEALEAPLFFSTHWSMLGYDIAILPYNASLGHNVEAINPLAVAV